MPFTVSHVAAILPLTRSGSGRGRLSGAALAIGSMAPDFPYFGLAPDVPTHSLQAVVTVDPAIGLVAFALWVGLLRAPLWSWAPAAFRRRWPPHRPSRDRSPAGVAWVVASLVIGSATHVFWDSFTHPGRWGVRRVAWLAGQHGPFTGYHWAQYGSSVFGGLVLLGWFAVQWRRASRQAGVTGAAGVTTECWGRGRWAWAAVAAAGVAGVAWGLLAPPTPDLRTELYEAAVRSLGLAVLTALLLSAGWALGPGRRYRPASQ